jgi:hypothetical protein
MLPCLAIARISYICWLVGRWAVSWKKESTPGFRKGIACLCPEPWLALRFYASVVLNVGEQAADGFAVVVAADGLS